MEQLDSKFRIKLENLPKVKAVIKALHGKESIDFDDGPSHFSWVDEDFYKLNTAIQLMQAFRWEPTIDDNGDVADINFTGEKLGDDKIFFEAIAPFVESDSYIEMKGEDDEKWRWVFKKGKLYEISPETIWPTVEAKERVEQK